jgi:hypothetical protein
LYNPRKKSSVIFRTNTGDSVLSADWLFSDGGEPRFTQDVDLTLFTGFQDEEVYIKKILSDFSPRIENLKEFAFKNRVLLIQSSSGVPIVISLGGLPFEKK